MRPLTINTMANIEKKDNIINAYDLFHAFENWVNDNPEKTKPQISTSRTSKN